MREGADVEGGASLMGWGARAIGAAMVDAERRAIGVVLGDELGEVVGVVGVGLEGVGHGAGFSGTSGREMGFGRGQNVREGAYLAVNSSGLRFRDDML